MKPITQRYVEVLEFATKAHEGQKRKYTHEPYINHPIEVANIIKGIGESEDVVCAALLHDVVEDTRVELIEIEQKFGIIIARLVEQLTDVYTKEAFPNIRRTERKMLECYRLSKICGPAKSIKLADLIDNTSSIVDNDPAFAKIYLKEKEEMLGVLSEGDQRLMFKAVQILKDSKEKLKNMVL